MKYEGNCVFSSTLLHVQKELTRSRCRLRKRRAESPMASMQSGKYLLGFPPHYDGNVVQLESRAMKAMIPGYRDIGIVS
jgi:hypothetical protein